MSLPGIAGVLAGVSAGGLGTIVVTVGVDGSFDPKSGLGSELYGYASSANSINGSAIGSRSPTTLLSATINGIFSLDDDVSPGLMKLVLNGNQTALSIMSVLINGHLYAFGAPVNSGGQTTWSASMVATGNQWGVAAGNPANAVFF